MLRWAHSWGLSGLMLSLCRRTVQRSRRKGKVEAKVKVVAPAVDVATGS
jgi:hypothetical protein